MGVMVVSDSNCLPCKSAGCFSAKELREEHLLSALLTLGRVGLLLITLWGTVDYKVSFCLVGEAKYWMKCKSKAQRLHIEW